MNSIWNKNLSLFKKRFQPLYGMLEEKILEFEKNPEQAMSFWKVLPAKNGSLTLEENGIRLHSAYNPEKEGNGLVTSAMAKNPEAENLVFMGFGLGYSVLEAASILQNTVTSLKTLIVIEPDVNHFLASLYFLDWQEVFTCESLVLLVSCPPEQVISVLNGFGVKKSAVAASRPFMLHSENYFNTLTQLIERNIQKEKINEATTKKFAKRWNENCIRNAETAVLSSGISIFEKKAENLPFTVIAAGPSLQKLLPYMAQIKKRTVLVCVDTALKALLSVKVKPDFVIITDPQYWAYRHIAGLKSSESILIASQDVYPSVFNFKCKKITVCSSQLPIGKYYEAKCGVKGDLGAGGSVASCAWNFARFAGAKTVFTCGLDLSFPKKMTHIRGSTFEQNAHVFSTRIKSAETQSLPLLFSGNPLPGENYRGEAVLTDQRMKMFAWWFESRFEECPEVSTFTLCDEGLKIPGMKLSSVEKLMELPEVDEEKQLFIQKSLDSSMSVSELQNLRLQFVRSNKFLLEKLKGVELDNFDQVVKILKNL